jgi:hypothetical protein
MLKAGTLTCRGHKHSFLSFAYTTPLKHRATNVKTQPGLLQLHPDFQPTRPGTQASPEPVCHQSQLARPCAKNGYPARRFGRGPSTLSERAPALKWGLALRCATSATSSITGPRAALTSTASGFIISRRSLFRRWRVVASRLQCRLTTCGQRVGGWWWWWCVCGGGGWGWGWEGRRRREQARTQQGTAVADCVSGACSIGVLLCAKCI